VIHAASTEERERLLADFVRYCEIESPSGSERAMADALISDLKALGLDVEEDDTAAATGAGSGNVLARIPATGDAPTVLLCAHMDTVPLDGPVEVVSENGLLTNKHEAILGADNKAAVATIMATARRLVYGDGGKPSTGVELLFTTGEEQALKGAKSFDMARLNADFGYVFDHASPIGEIVVASPTYYSVEGRFRGQAAHAGIRPEAGHNAIVAAAKAIAAMRIGRVDDQTTANVGRIAGGTSANVVAERCYVELETRSIDAERAAQMVTEMVDALTEAASDCECDVETFVERLFQGYRLPRTTAAVEVAAAALQENEIEPVYLTSGGGSDANVFIPAGLTVVNLANGTERNHQPDESVTLDSLAVMVEVTSSLITQAALIAAQTTLDD
jgi:tripeptide aminopeptidase